jgi:hypothetical protein
MPEGYASPELSASRVVLGHMETVFRERDRETAAALIKKLHLQAYGREV